MRARAPQALVLPQQESEQALQLALAPRAQQALQLVQAVERKRAPQLVPHMLAEEQAHIAVLVTA